LNVAQRYLDYIKQNALWQPPDHLLLAVSGGIDSVVLAHLTKEAGFPFSIVHCNFHLRGAESERDEKFVRELAEKMEVDFYLENFATQHFARENKLSIQEAARDLRYHWFKEILTGNVNPVMGFRQSKPGYIVTAHNMDDNVETVLMNFCKGTGMRGLKGMSPKKDKLIRPLLFASREDIVGYAKEKKIDWVEDSSNAEEKYTRNYFRHTVIPAIEKIYPQLKQQVRDNIARLNDASLLYDSAIEVHKKKLLEVKDDEVLISILKLKRLPAFQTVIYEVIKDFGFTNNQVGEVVRLFDADNASYIQSPSHRIIKNRKWLIISLLQAKKSSYFLIEKPGDKVVLDSSQLIVKEVEKQQVSFGSEEQVYLTADKIHFPLVIRKWKQGDYFYPLGMPKKKKLARFFIDSKLSVTEKENIWVVESDKKIIWIAGHRIDDRFKILPSTKKILSFTLSSLSR
jgi:tRNA(Ile)-lysidine synthase